MTSLYNSNNGQLNTDMLQKEMLHIFDNKKSKRESYQVEYFIENDPRTHYKTVYKDEV